MNKISAALILDSNLIENWQREALNHASDVLDIKLILNCENTNNKKSIFKNFFYYLINFCSLKNNNSIKTKFQRDELKTISFKSLYSGAWQSIPKEISKQILKDDIKLVIKFGMSLLAIDESLQQLDILSFHHGDPEYYRGRPAGFYEIYNNDSRVGIIVQKLSNTLDGGLIYARGFSKIYNYSYKKTAFNFFQNSKFLLRKAVVNYGNNQTVLISKLGKNYTLPSNFQSTLFIVIMLKRKINRIIYGLFFEKNWNIIKIPLSSDDPFRSALSTQHGNIPEIDAKYTFYADPFYSIDGTKIRLEALNKTNGLGEIIEVNSETLAVENSLLRGAHFSFPFPISHKLEEFIAPETGSHSPPFLLNLSTGNKINISFVDDTEVRLVDISIFHHNNIFFLFASKTQSSLDCLYLFSSKNLEGPYASHPSNPIVIDPSCARMAGKIFSLDGQLYRFGQNNSYGYGDKIAVQKIILLSEHSYSEEYFKEIFFSDASGPHTIDFFQNDVIYDFYVNRFSIFAGVRRVIAKLRSSVIG